MRAVNLLSALPVIVALSVATPAQAEQPGDHDVARRAVEEGEALPLSRIIAIALDTVPGEVLEVELERENGRLIYEIEVLARDGRVRSIEIDARTGAVLEVEDDD